MFCTLTSKIRHRICGTFLPCCRERVPPIGCQRLPSDDLRCQRRTPSDGQFDNDDEAHQAITHTKQLNEIYFTHLENVQLNTDSRFSAFVNPVYENNDIENMNNIVHEQAVV